MKFQRNVRIFRGQLDAAPIAGVFFLLVFFILLNSSLVYRPGLRVLLGNEADTSPNSPQQMVRVDARDRISYKGAVLKEEEFQQRLRTEASRNRAPKLITIRTEPGSRTDLIQRLKWLGAELSIPVEVQKGGLDLPEGEDLPGATGAQVVLAVSHNQQIFFDNQMVKLADVKQSLLRAREKVKDPLTLVIHADKSVTYEFVMDLAQMARACGYAEVLLGTRPRISPAPEPSGNPK